MTTQQLLLLIYVVLGPLAWAVVGFVVHVGRVRMMLLSRAVRPLPQPGPTVTILIPAKDEAVRIGDCLTSALSQDYPSFNVIAVDDRSSDNTGAVMDEMARSNPRLKVVHIAEGSLPEGWTGKCNALYRGVQDARGDWLLFVDSDVILAPNALRATLALAVSRGYHLLSLLPRLEGHSFWEKLVVPLSGGALLMIHLVAITNDDNRATFFANGQFMLFRRDTYDAVGGHEAVRNHFCEDIQFARLVKSRGLPARISWGTEIASVRMYCNLRAILRGWSRIFFAGSVGRPLGILLGILFIVLCVYPLYPAAAWAVHQLIAATDSPITWAWAIAAVVHFLLMSFAVALMYAWTGNARRYALFLPLSSAMLIVIFLRSLHLCATGRLEWRGTRYSPQMSVSAPPGKAT